MPAWLSILPNVNLADPQLYLVTAVLLFSVPQLTSLTHPLAPVGHITTRTLTLILTFTLTFTLILTLILTLIILFLTL